ncbi:hypothetical protein M878_23200 [Streptomyces roseochromogenus subsp. oscitans DS 12.976]|uniref:Uncharacterized protein n=1 Tax=Streptomyces roseochromogenus subsp. oscitans DS 12.976 TaxID=1352936 RepID=V6K7M4_STRRC|nr:hypothetical protein M878_23200 [Streptomyces roseochromogenus subsp. oscitans DS 12.976]
MNSCAAASRAACSISVSVAPGRPQAMFSRIVPLRIRVCCGSRAICSRRKCRGRSLSGTPSRVITPAEGS